MAEAGGRNADEGPTLMASEQAKANVQAPVLHALQVGEGSIPEDSPPLSSGPSW
jgi:hypothetical protein